MIHFLSIVSSAGLLIVVPPAVKTLFMQPGTRCFITVVCKMLPNWKLVVWQEKVSDSTRTAVIVILSPLVRGHFAHQTLAEGQEAARRANEFQCLSAGL